MYQLYQNPGWGSAIIEAQLAVLGLTFALVAVGDVFDDAAARTAYQRVNPLGQVPALVLPDGQLMTETAAITLHLADLTGSTRLVPGSSEPERAAFLRWLVYLVAQIYANFAYADAPERFVPEDQAEAYQARVIETRKDRWRVMEAEAVARGGPWFLGARFSAIDIFLAVMVHWRPRQDWFAAECPAIAAIAARASALPEVALVMSRNFG